MGRRGHAPNAGKVVGGKLLYEDIILGTILRIRAQDARTGKVKLFSLRTAGFRVETNNGAEVRIPVFQFMGGNFCFYGGDRRSARGLRRDALMIGGISAQHVPMFGYHEIGFAEIRIGRDHSFLFVGERLESMYVHAIASIQVEAPRPGWRSPTDDVARFVTRVRRVQARAEEIARQREQRLRRAMVVITSNSVYVLSAADVYGVRTLQRRGVALTLQGRLVSLYRGEGMCFHLLGQAKALRTTVVLGVEPDPDED